MLQALATLEAAEPDITRSQLEERFLTLIFREQLPRPEVNASVGPSEVDFLWREQRLIVEADGGATHATPTAFEDDRRRDAELTAGGWRVLRFTWRQIVYEPGSAVAAITRVMAG